MPVRYASSLVMLCVLFCSVGCSDQHASEQADRAVSGLRVNTVLGDDGEQGDAFLKASAPRTFLFPTDHGAHPGYRSEWWYLTAVLRDADGNDYGLHYTLFRQALTPARTGTGPWHTGQAYLGHLALTDVSQQQHLEAERFSRGHPGIAGVEIDPSSDFRAMIEDWELAGTLDPFSLQLSAAEPDAFSVDVNISQVEPIVMQGDRGWSEKGPGSASYYYSMPRLEISGRISLSDKDIEVQGLGWLDREWSTSLLGDHLSGWDWLALQLEDGRSLMAFQLRRKDGVRDPYEHGLLVQHDEVADLPVVGTGDTGVRLLKRGDFTIQATRYFTDNTGVAWPVSWQLDIGEESFTVNALVDDQRVSLAIVYWEGLVEVRNRSGKRIGRGYVELTGYQ